MIFFTLRSAGILGLIGGLFFGGICVYGLVTRTGEAEAITASLQLGGVGLVFLIVGILLLIIDKRRR